MKEKILETLSDLGFKLEEADDLGYSFFYEGTNYLYLPADDDEAFLNISIPGIEDFDENDPQKGLTLLEKINSNLKYVKAYIMGKYIWLFYERELFGNEDLKQVLSRMIMRLDTALFFARKEMAALDNNDDKEE